MRFSLFRFIAVLSFFVFGACQTLDIRERTELSREQKNFFDKAEKDDGYSYLEFYQDGKKVFGGDFEWILQENGSYSFDVLAPFGNSLMTGLKKKESLVCHGSAFPKKLEMPIDFEDFLHYENHWIPLKSKELACFLRGYLSKEWLEKELFSVGSTGKKIYFSEGHRDVLVEFFSGKKTKSLKKVCAEISWQSFWIFKTSKIILCFSKEEPVSSSLNFDDRFELKTKELYED